MKRRSESLLASAALALLLGLVLLYGCRAFDPEPVIVNRPPDTFIVGAPAETTGTIFRRHLYWHGSDIDGQVVRFIWAITDSTVRNLDDPDTDEEDSRFDPADDITTTIPREGVEVGWTTRTDSIFEFAINRSSNLSKDITFHLVAIDDRGAIDPTPARLHFIDNSLGNPQLRFRVITLDGPGGAEHLRWKGTPEGPDPDSPEATEQPFVGFAKPFRIEWEASSPNGPIVGFRYQPSEASGAPVLPLSPPGEEIWGNVTSFSYSNDVALDQLPGGCDGGPDCPEMRRWVSGPHRIQVTALDVAEVQSEGPAGELVFQSNYPPETDLDIGGVFPQYRIPDGAGGQTVVAFGPADTIPSGAYAVFRMQAFDRLDTTPGLSDSFCCDQRLDAAVPEVTFQGQVRYRALNDLNTIQRFTDGFNAAGPTDTLGFRVGPFDYTFIGRSKDEHGRPDDSPPSMSFVAGFQPRIVGLLPAEGDSLILRDPTRPGRWPQNTVDYTVVPNVNKYWDGRQYFDTPAPDRQLVPGALFRYTLRLEGSADPREPAEAIRSWAYALKGEGDPNNLINDGAGTDNDKIDTQPIFDRSPQPNLWLMENQDAPEIFVPALIWTLPDLFDPGSSTPPFNEVGPFLTRFVGQMTLEAIGKTKSPDSKFRRFPVTVRPDASSFVDIPMGSLGRRSPKSTHHFVILLGVDPNKDEVIDRFWPLP